MTKPVTIIMIEDDEGHARLIERNIRRSGVNNEILPFTNGTAAVNHLFGSDGTGVNHKDQALLILLDLNLPDMTGIDILRRVKENNYLKCAPVVVRTTTGAHLRYLFSLTRRRISMPVISGRFRSSRINSARSP